MIYTSRNAGYSANRLVSVQRTKNRTSSLRYSHTSQAIERSSLHRVSYKYTASDLQVTLTTCKTRPPQKEIGGHTKIQRVLM
uniref:Uncharacterized protein n=1 Tax=Anguilla anguilla TaxID=7936 RepID=A0A0E9WN21_ANGAN